MSRNLQAVFIGMLLVLTVGFADIAQAKTAIANPIDEAFAQDFQTAQSSVEINYVAEQYLQAWQAELEHAAAMMKGKYKYDEDKDRIDAYVASYTKVAAAAAEVEWLNWSDTDAPPQIRHFGTGAAGASMSAKANIYKQATLNLITVYQGPAGEVKYPYLYNGSGAGLAKIEAQHN